MLLFFESVMYNNTQNDQQSEEDQSEEKQSEEEQVEDVFASFEPIKRYHLISQLMKMQNNLRTINYENTVLNMLIKFVDNVSYEHLLIIIPKLLNSIEQELKIKRKS